MVAHRKVGQPMGSGVWMAVPLRSGTSDVKVWAESQVRRGICPHRWLTPREAPHWHSRASAPTSSACFVQCHIFCLSAPAGPWVLKNEGRCQWGLNLLLHLWWWEGIFHRLASRSFNTCFSSTAYILPVWAPADMFIASGLDPWLIYTGWVNTEGGRDISESCILPGTATTWL